MSWTLMTGASTKATGRLLYAGGLSLLVYQLTEIIGSRNCAMARQMPRHFTHDPKKIENINIKGGVIIRLENKEIKTVSLKKYREWARPACLYCLDYGAENADIGAGGIGLDGWTYTLIRTKRGHEAFQAALADGWLETRPLSDEPRGEFLMNRLSMLKKKNRPLPRLMPTFEERKAMGSLCPKTFYTSGPGAPKKQEGSEK